MFFLKSNEYKASSVSASVMGVMGGHVRNEIFFLSQDWYACRRRLYRLGHIFKLKARDSRRVAVSYGLGPRN